MKPLYTLLFSILCFTSFGQQLCLPEEVLVTVEIRTDPYGYETSWELIGSSGTVYASVDYNTYDNHTTYTEHVCVPEDECLSFSIYDSYGDGIFSPGYYSVSIDTVEIASGGSFQSSETTNFNCAPGEVCNNPMPITEGIHTTNYDDHWYAFTPDSVGTYLISTCGLDSCDTKIWVYDSCEGNGEAEDNEGTIFYNDDHADCGLQSQINAWFAPGVTYYIRVGDKDDLCADSITWEIYYLGPVEGCTDPTSCNYNPLATIDDGSCLPQGDPDCPAGPDLLVREDILVSTIELDQIEADDGCLILEGCLTGYGTRDIVRFGTQIENIGELDYYIGTPEEDNNQFTWDNCHNHYHYDGYAEYILFTEDGVELPIGFKNGFCVIDLGCTTGTAQYGCNNMGISAGCYDLYWSALECQWIDITDVPDGRYTFVTRVNWDNAPDFLGNVEKDTLNNWAQACLEIDRTSGSLVVTVDEACETYVDCNGDPYGSAQPDCEGVCNGSAVRGDLNVNGLQEMIDAEMYIPGILGHDLEATSCNDLNADGEMTVYDAALLSNCLVYGASHPHEGQGAHDHCNLPGGLVNILDTVTLSIMDINYENQYLDIAITNPTAQITAYQFQMSGITVANVENLVDPSVYPVFPQASINDAMVIGISFQDSTITKSQDPQALVRIHWMEITEEFICIDQIVEVINQDYEETVPVIVDGCVTFSPSSTFENSNTVNVEVRPNPFAQSTTIYFGNTNADPYQLRILDWNGKVVQEFTNITSNSVEIDGSNWPSGIYVYQLIGDKGHAIGKLDVQQ